MKYLRWLDLHFEELILAIFLVVITLSTGLQVFMRYVMNNSLTWAEELSRFCFVFSGFLSVGYCIRRENEIKLDIVTILIPKRLHVVLDALTRVLEVIIFTYLFNGMKDVYLASAQIGQKASAIQIPMKFVYGFCWICMGIAVLRATQSFVIDIIRIVKKTTI